MVPIETKIHPDESRLLKKGSRDDFTWLSSELWWLVKLSYHLLVEKSRF